MDIRDILAYNLRWHRKMQGLSQTQVAIRADINRTYLSAVERSKYAISVDVLERIARALGLNSNDLVIHPELYERSDQRQRYIPDIDASRNFVVDLNTSVLPAYECAAHLLSFLAYPEINSNAAWRRKTLEQAICNAFARKMASQNQEWGLRAQTFRPTYLLFPERDTEKALKSFERQITKRFIVAKTVSDIVGNNPRRADIMEVPLKGHQLHLRKIAESIAPSIGDKDIPNILSRVWAPGFSVVHLAMALIWLRSGEPLSSDSIYSTVYDLCADKGKLPYTLKVAENFRIRILATVQLGKNRRSLIQFREK